LKDGSTDDEDVLSLDEVFEEEEVLRLALGAEEWEVVIALAEVGGVGQAGELRNMTRMSGDLIQEVIRSLLQKGVVEKTMPSKPQEASPAAPDAEVAQYLEYLRDLNCYQVLQINPDADENQVRSSYYRLMRKYHPDRFMSEKNPKTGEQLKDIFRILTRAYETLSDPQARREYDLTIPDFTGALDKEDDLAFEALWSGDIGPGPLPDAGPDLAVSFYESAVEDFANDNYETAELNFKLAAALDPENDDYQAGLAKARRIVNQKKAAKKADRASELEKEGRPAAAIRALSRAIELDPEAAQYRFDLARMIEAHGRDLHSARMHVLLALDRRPGKVRWLMLFGKIQERLGELKDAARTYKKVLGLDSGNKEAAARLESLKKV